MARTPPVAANPKKDRTNDETLEHDEAAKFLGIAPQTLYRWNCTRLHIVPHRKIGRKCLYWKSDLIDFIESQPVGVG